MSKPRDKVHTIMRMYTQQHKLDLSYLKEKKMLAQLWNDGGVYRFFLPSEIVLMHEISSCCKLPLDLRSAFELVGNQIVPAHAVTAFLALLGSEVHSQTLDVGQAFELFVNQLWTPHVVLSTVRQEQVHLCSKFSAPSRSNCSNRTMACAS